MIAKRFFIRYSNSWPWSAPGPGSGVDPPRACECPAAFRGSSGAEGRVRPPDERQLEALHRMDGWMDGLIDSDLFI